jgi:hypothetical protein
VPPEPELALEPVPELAVVASEVEPEDGAFSSPEHALSTLARTRRGDSRWSIAKDYHFSRAPGSLEQSFDRAPPGCDAAIRVETDFFSASRVCDGMSRGEPHIGALSLDGGSGMDIDHENRCTR